MNAATFAEQVKAMSDRLGDFYNGVETTSFSDATLVSAALKELGIASERLEIAATLMQQQQQELESAEQDAAVKRQRYQDLLEFIPHACLTTDVTGSIREANRAVGELFAVQPALLVGKPLIRFVAPDAQPHFQSQLERLRQQSWRQEWQIQLQPPHGDPIEAIATVKVDERTTNPTRILRWLLRQNTCPPLQEQDSHRTLHRYHKGEIIPLEPQVLWQVRQGLVKLTTFCENGEELLAGIANPSTLFGASLVATPFYQAIAMTDTQLWSIPLTEIDSSPTLAKSLLPQIGQRLRQSEALLTIYGQQCVEDRLEALLLFLKREVGEPVPQGMRLAVRFTHEDLASACRTTRATVTRTLSRFARQKKISIDPKQHIILL